MQETINKGVEELKRNQATMNNTINEIKSTREGINSRITEEEMGEKGQKLCDPFPKLTFFTL